MPEINRLPLAEIKFVDLERQRPPLVSLRFDITLRNELLEPRWYVLPFSMNLPPGKGVDGGDVLELQGQGRVFLWRFQGTAGFQAVCLPGEAEVTIRNFSVSYWGALAERSQLEFDVGIAEQVLIDREPIESWHGDVPFSDRDAVVDAALAMRRSAKFTPDRHEVPVDFLQMRNVSVRVLLSPKES